MSFLFSDKSDHLGIGGLVHGLWGLDGLGFNSLACKLRVL